jgi:hypothetical protein
LKLKQLVLLLLLGISFATEKVSLVGLFANGYDARTVSGNTAWKTANDACLHRNRKQLKFKSRVKQITKSCGQRGDMARDKVLLAFDRKRMADSED